MTERFWRNRRPTIGLLTRQVDLEYAAAQLQGVSDAARELDANWIHFPVGLLRDIHREAHTNVLYDLASAERLDGLIIWAGALNWFVGREELQDLFRRYQPLPIVSGEVAIEGIPSLLIDNYQGMREAVAHLIQVHGYRRIAFIRGAEGHTAMQERYRAYTETLTEHGLPLDPNLVSSPSNTAEEVETAITTCLLRNKRGIDCEAVVAAGDTIALLVLRILQAQGLRVPDDVAMVGFDDEKRVSTVQPPLTTVKVPFDEMGRRAVELVLAQLRGEPVPEQVIVPGRLIVRQSCGCPIPRIAQAAVGLVTGTGGTFAASCMTRRNDILSEMIQTMASSSVSIGSEQVGQLLDTFLAELKRESPGVFVSTLERILYQVAAAEGEVAAWQTAVSALRCHVLPDLGNHEARDRAEDLWQQARVLIGEIALWAQARRQFQAEQRSVVLRKASQTILATFEMVDLMNVLAQELPRVGIPSCYLSLYEGKDMPSEWSRLMLAYDERGRAELGANGRRFPSRQLAPDDLLPQGRQYGMMVQPLYYRENQFGFAMFELGPREGVMCMTLRAQLSSALNGILLLQAHKQAEEQLQRYSGELAQSNEELRRFTYIVSHDLRAPLVNLKGFAAELASALDVIRPAFETLLPHMNENQRAAVMTTLLEDMPEDLSFMDASVTRMDHFISALLTLSRLGHCELNLERINTEALVRDTLETLAHQIEQRQVKMTVGALPEIVADRTSLEQILGNILNNAILYLEPSRPGEIEITGERNADETLFRIRDNGRGIAPEDMDKVFAPFRRAGKQDVPGEGMGLAYVQTLVRRHGGRIWCESEPGIGTTFAFTISHQFTQGDSHD